MFTPFYNVELFCKYVQQINFRKIYSTERFGKNSVFAPEK